MYEAFFGLRMKPFELVPNPEMLYASRGHRRAMRYLEYGFSEGAGFILLTGEVGSGKTTLIRDLVRKLDQNTSRAMIFNTLVDFQQLLAMINEEFGLPVEGRDKVALLRELNDFLVEQYAQRKRPMVIIDEAQNLDLRTLEEIRLLSNLELDVGKLLQVILVGQPELKMLVAQPSLRQLRQRISVNCHLGALDREETEAYIYHRLEKAGNRQAADFAPGAIEEIHRASRGIPRLINICCDFILLTGYIEGSRELDLELVREVVADIELGQGEAAAPGAADDRFDSLTEKLDELARGQAGAAEFQGRLEAIQDRLERHERVLRRVVKTQQHQNRCLVQSLEEINLHLKSLLPQEAGTSRGQVRVIESR